MAYVVLICYTKENALPLCALFYPLWKLQASSIHVTQYGIYLFIYLFKCYYFFVCFLSLNRSFWATLMSFHWLFRCLLSTVCKMLFIYFLRRIFHYSIVIRQFWQSASQWEWYLSQNSSVEEEIIPAPSLPWILCFEYCVTCSISLILLV